MLGSVEEDLPAACTGASALFGSLERERASFGKVHTDRRCCCVTERCALTGRSLDYEIGPLLFSCVGTRCRSCFTLQLLEERAQDALKFVEASRKLMKGPSEKWEKECKVLSQLTDRHKTLSMKGFNTSVKEAEEKKEKAQREVH